MSAGSPVSFVLFEIENLDSLRAPHGGRHLDQAVPGEIERGQAVHPFKGWELLEHVVVEPKAAQ